MSNEISLPTLTSTESYHIAKSVFDNLNSLRSFVKEFGLDTLESCQSKVNQVVDEINESIAKEEKRKKLHVEALEEAAQVYLDAMKKAGIPFTLDAAKAAMLGATQEKGTAAQTTSTKVRAPRGSKEVLTYTLEVNGKTFEKIGLGVKGSFAKLEEDFKAVGATKEEKWKFIVESEHDRFFEQLKAKKLSSHIDEAEAKDYYGRDMMPEVDLSDKVDYGTITITKQRATEEFGFELIEDFIYNGSQDELTKEQQDFLIKISNDGTVEGGVEVIEALD